MHSLAEGYVCPSARCEEGARLLGIVGSDGRVGFLVPPLPVDAEFVRHAHEGRSPERRFRFAAACVEDRCGYWTGERCGVVDAAVSTLKDQGVPSPRPCGIRASCRWFSQHGVDACQVCPLIVTDVGPEA
jgi:hypothetical protein